MAKNAKTNYELLEFHPTMSSSNSGGAPFTNEDPLSARSHDCGIVEAGLGNSFLYLGNSGANRGGEKIGT